MSARTVVPVAVVLLTAVPVLLLCVGQALGLRVERAGGRLRVRRSDAPRAGGWTWWRRAALVVVLGVVGLTPTTAATQAGGARVGVQVWFVVDRTGSMAAEDWARATPWSAARACRPSRPCSVSTACATTWSRSRATCPAARTRWWASPTRRARSCP
ncbi:hypothetical protein [Cellulomonas sp. FA1]|uniref:hypothetical protein n=1 Tax=Cellulomonas sp. FA1 TaxID=1346710 RepID=UPI0006996482|nr:hypothetical protein [Cellulomonas sp. FA1]